MVLEGLGHWWVIKLDCRAVLASVMAVLGGSRGSRALMGDFA